MNRIVSLAIVLTAALATSCATVSESAPFPNVVLPNAPTVSYVLGGAPRAAVTATVLPELFFQILGGTKPTMEAVEGARKVDIYAGPEAWELVVVFGATKANIAAAPRVGAVFLAPDVLAFTRSPAVGARLRESAARGYRPEPLFLEGEETVRAFSAFPPPRALTEMREQLSRAFPAAPASCAGGATRAEWAAMVVDPKHVRGRYHYPAARFAAAEKDDAVRCIERLPEAKFTAIAQRGNDVAYEIRVGEMLEDALARMKR